jgi:hypothetical protein
MIRIGPADMGALYPVTALAAQSVTSSSAALGGYTNQKWKDYYLLRREAASQPADRVRRVVSYIASTGQWIHEGAAYGDTTITGEDVELWKYDPLLYVDPSVNEAIKDIRRLQMVELPSLMTERHTLHGLPGISSIIEIERIEAASSRQLTRNRFFDHWNDRTSAGVLQPDYWTIAGASATMARSTTQLWRGKYTLAITRSGTDATVTQVVGLLETGVSADSLRSKQVTAVLVGLASEDIQLRIGINDGVTTTWSSYHTGSSTFEELTVEKTLAATATKCDVVIAINTENAVCNVGEAYAVTDDVTDTDRRGSYPSHRVYPQRLEQGSSFPVQLFGGGRGNCFHVYLRRPYAEFTASRIAGGTADADEADAPLEIVAVGALAKMFGRLGKVAQAHDEAQYMRLHARQYQRDFERMALQHLVQSGASSGSRPLFGRSWSGPVQIGRFR